jgi:hypothetical protein
MPRAACVGGFCPDGACADSGKRDDRAISAAELSYSVAVYHRPAAKGPGSSSAAVPRTLPY